MNAIKTIVFFVTIVVIAVVMGVAVTDPMSLQSMGLLAGVFGALVFPMFIRWYGYVLAFSMTSGLIVPFVPGKPYLWTAMAAVTLLMAIVDNTLRKQRTYQHVPQLVFPLFAFVAVVGLTMLARGGVGGQAFGSDMWGARRYYFIFAAALAFFAFANLIIPEKRARLFTILFFGGAVVQVLTDIAYWSGGALNMVFLVFHSELAGANRASFSEIGRAQGTAIASLGTISAILAVVNLNRLLDPRRWWLILLLVAIFSVGLLGGFRSAFVVVGMLLGVLVYLNRLYFSPRVVALGAAGVILFVFLLLFSTSLPLNIQRAISFLPVEVDPLARQDSSGTMIWRLEMWSAAVHEIPQYLLLGKGFAYSGSEMEWIENMGSRVRSFEGALLASWYHSGPLTLIICLGLPGTITFVWLLTACLKFLKRQWTLGSPALRSINLFVYAVFIQRTIHFVFFYGQIELDVISFVSLVGFSLAINGNRAYGPSPEVVAIGERRTPISLVSAKSGAAVSG